MPWGSHIRCVGGAIVLLGGVLALPARGQTTVPRSPFPPVSQPGGLALGPEIDPRVARSMAKAQMQDRFARMVKDSHKLADLSQKFVSESEQPDSASNRAALDKEAAEMERLSREIRNLMRQD